MDNRYRAEVEEGVVSVLTEIANKTFADRFITRSGVSVAEIMASRSNEAFSSSNLITCKSKARRMNVSLLPFHQPSK